MRFQVARLFGCLVVLFVFLSPPALHAQTPEQFLEQAVSLAQKSQRDTAVPASVTLAQAIWETGYGASPIGAANNYFGIKAAGTTDETVSVGPVAIGWVWAWTKEWNGARFVEQRERFRKYKNIQDSFRDHALLLATNPRYANAMRAVDDPREFARRIAHAGYATSPSYASDLIRVMDAENLYQYDLPRNAMRVLEQSETVQVNAGEIFQIYFDVRNEGFGTWSPAANYYVISANENRFGANTRQELKELVPPEQIKRWSITMIAPSEAGVYTTAWQLKHGNQDVGEPMRAQIRVQMRAEWQVWLVGGIVGAGIAALAFTMLLYRKKTSRTGLAAARGKITRQGHSPL